LTGRAAGLGGNLRLVPAGTGANGVIRAAHNSFKGIGLAGRAGYLNFFAGAGKEFLKNSAALQAPEFKYRHCVAP